MDCNCPEEKSLVEIIAENCGIDLKQIQKIAFQRDRSFGIFNPSSIVDLPAWQAFLTAGNDDKIVITPFIGGDPIIEAGDKITTGGGDNSTLNGVEELEGVNPSNFSCVFKSLSPLVESQIKALICEKRLTVYLFLQGGRIACWSEDVTNPDNAINKGIPIQSFFLSDRNNAGFGTKDTFNCSFSLVESWSEKLVIFKPTWNPLTDL